jgi:replicative DNA helicase
MSDRVYPSSVESERALLGGLLLDPARLDDVEGLIEVSDFYRPDHGALFALLVDMSRAKEPIEPVTVLERMSRGGEAERYGGVGYVTELPDHAPGTANLPYYAKILREKALLRRFVELAQGLTEEALAQPEDVTELLDRAARGLTEMREGRETSEWEQVSLIVDKELERLEELSKRPEGVTGVPSGFTDLDNVLAGLQRSDLVILAARPSMGKTALALNFAQNAALDGGAVVAIFSLEMSRGQLVTRMLCAEARVDASKVRTGRLDDADWEAFIEASDVLRRARIHIVDSPGLSIGEVTVRARRLHQEKGPIDLVVIDYLQLMQGDDPKARREQQISGISRGLKALAKELNAPVVALSQLNRGVESRQEKRPMLSDLRESGAIEQDADVIMFIYRDEYYNPESPDKGLAEVIVAKHRNGPTGTVKLVFQGRHTRFDDLVPDDIGAL